MHRYIFLILAIGFTSSSFSQTTASEKSEDTTSYNTYYNPIDSIFFSYPKSWDTTKFSKDYIFTAMDNSSNPSDKFKENLIFGKVEISADLEFLLKSAAQSLLAEDNHVGIIEQQIKTNPNGVEYAILKDTLTINSIPLLTTNIYFKKGNYGYYIVFGNKRGEEKKYSKIYAEVARSIKFRN